MKLEGLAHKQVNHTIWMAEVTMVPTDHDISFLRTFQGLLRYIFKDFLCSFKHPFAKNDQQWTFK